MDKVNRGMEHFWMAVAIASLIYAIWQCVAHGWSEGYRNFVVPVLAFVWFLFRRMMRKRMARNLNNPEDQP